MRAADWAGWVQAIGSIAAIWGALWIYSQDKVERHSEKRALAIVAAAGMNYSIAIFVAQLEAARRVFHVAAEQGFSDSHVQSVKRKLAGRPSWTTEELARLIPIGNTVAQDLASGMNRVELVERFLEKALPAERERERRIKLALVCRDRMDQAIGLIKQSHKELRSLTPTWAPPEIGDQ